MSNSQGVLMQVSQLRVHFPIYNKALFSRQIGEVKAVDGVSFTLREGETMGLVGESGCGKTTTGKALLNLYPRYTTGEVLFEGKDILKMPDAEFRPIRRNMQMIFQDPYSSLDPRMTVQEIIEEPLIIHRLADSKKERRERVLELLDVVGFSSKMADRYPSEFSGGQRQRIGIARALALNPKLLICDEPVSALDVSVQSQILNLLGDLRKKYNISMIFIAHGLNVVRHVSDRIGVMYLGHLVEVAEKKTLYDEPLHPYTKALLSAIPVPDPTVELHRIPLVGDVPSPVNPPSGCPFHTRCQYADQCGSRCSEEPPPMREVRKGHFVMCHLFDNNSNAKEIEDAAAIN